MNGKFKRLTLLFGLIVLAGNVFAQPKPWTFGENVVISPNLYTGTMQLAIPFYTYKDADFEIPVNFGYSSSGCVANVRGGIMGPGWGVNVGGSITREIRGIPDEKNIELKHLYGFYALHKSGITQTVYSLLGKLFRVFGYDMYRTIGISAPTGNLSPYLVYCPDGKLASNYYATSTRYDAEPDIFHFNFMGYSGTFHLGLNGEITVYNTNIDSKNFKIDIESETGSEVMYIFSKINIYTSDGYKYIFDCNRESYSVGFSWTIGDNETPPETKGEAVSWSLSNMIAPNGRIVTFDYEQRQIQNYIPSNLYSTGTYLANTFWFDFEHGNLVPIIENENLQNPMNGEEHKFYKNVTYMPILKTITVNAANNTAVAEIKFNYVTQNSLGKEQYRAFETTLKDIDDESVKLSSIVVNSKMNSTATKLKECNLTYMRNTNGAKTSYLKDITIQGEGTYSMSYLNWNNSTYPYPANGTFSVDHWGYYNGRNNNNSTSIPFIKIINPNTSLEEYIYYQYRDHYTEYAKCGMLNQITYPTGGHYTFEYENHDYRKAVKRMYSNNFIPKVINTPGNCGGLRIKAIKNYSDNNNSSLISTRTYTYENDDNSNYTSSGILLNMPRYYITYSASLSGTNLNDNNMTFRSSDLTEFNNIHIEYSKVQEILNDNSKIEYNFTNSSIPGYTDTISYVYTSEKIYKNNSNSEYYIATATSHSHSTLCNIVAPVSSKQFMRGRLLKTEMFSSSSSATPVYSETNTYENTYTNSQTYVPHYYVRALGYMPVYTGKYNMQSTTQTQHINGVEVNRTNSCTYNSYGQVASQTTTDSKGITQIVEYKYVTDTTINVNGSRIIDIMMKNNVINLPLREEVYVVENGVKAKIGGRRYTYFNPVASKPAMIRLLQAEIYDSETGSWITDAKYNAYDSYGNLLEEEDGNGLKTSYIYGYNGLYKIAEINNCSLAQVKNISGLGNIQTTPLAANMTATAENSLRNIQGAEVATFDYKPFVGLVKIKDSTGRSVSYTYNKHGKLEKVINTAGEPEIRYNYSTDNN